MIKKIEFTLVSKHADRPFLADLCFDTDKRRESTPVIIFAHGFKGFKDWGAFNLMADYFSKQGFIFVKLNFSHNGTTPEHPVDFIDLEAFGNNNYSIECDDLGTLIDYLYEGKSPLGNLKHSDYYLIGHSRGGGISLIKGSEDKRIKKLVTWASINTVEGLISQEEMQRWEKEGVYYVYNSRTKQKMPLYFQLCQNYFKNKERLSVEKASASLTIPCLIIHGTADETVPVLAAYKLKESINTAELAIIEGANHTFSLVHPYNAEIFPEHFELVLTKTINFFKTNSNTI